MWPLIVLFIANSVVWSPLLLNISTKIKACILIPIIPQPEVPVRKRTKKINPPSSVHTSHRILMQYSSQRSWYPAPFLIPYMY